MKLLIDDANIEMIQLLYKYLPVDGVTSNPSILSKMGRNPYEILKEIRDYIGSDSELHVQVVSTNAVDMLKEAVKIRKELGESTFIKVPVTKEGLIAMKELHKEGIRITATAIYSELQGYLAGKAGADYAAPYVNRIDNLEMNGVQAAKDLHDIYRQYNFKTEVLAASFKNSLQVLELVKHGVGAATVSPDVLAGFIGRDYVMNAVDGFTRDFEELCGKGKTMIDC